MFEQIPAHERGSTPSAGTPQSVEAVSIINYLHNSTNPIEARDMEEENIHDERPSRELNTANRCGKRLWLSCLTN